MGRAKGSEIRNVGGIGLQEKAHWMARGPEDLQEPGFDDVRAVQATIQGARRLSEDREI